MNTNIVPFEFEGNAVRVVERVGEPWFVLADVCRVLEIGNPSQAATRLDDDEKATLTNNEGQAGQGAQQFTVINESGLYSLILTSRKPAAKRFKKWVTADVLPTIRKTGGYGSATALPDLSDPVVLQSLILEQCTKRIEAEKRAVVAEQKVEAAQPVIEAFDRIANAEGSMSITEAAKALQCQRIKDLTSWLHAQKWIYRRAGNKDWLAHQDKLRSGLLEHKVAVVPDRLNGGDRVVERVRVTPAGLAHLAKKLGGSSANGHTQH